MPDSKLSTLTLWSSFREDWQERFGGSDQDFSKYQYDPIAYCRDFFGWEPWRGTEAEPGQAQIVEAYVLALRQLHERLAFQAGELTLEELQYWKPGEIIKNRIRVEAGHGVGKTKGADLLVNHFFDCFIPSIIYAFAPNREQIHDLLFKEIKDDRRKSGLPGRILELELFRSDSHFVKGKATNDANGAGTERVQGQHNKYLMFVLDEAEGVADFVWGAIDSMASGGICIVLMLANPKTRTSIFHKQKSHRNVRSFRMSCVSHPNVVAGREIIPGAVAREYILDMVEKHCVAVEVDDPDNHTFTLPFEVFCGDMTHPAGTILRPNPEFMFRVLGIAPSNLADDTFVPVGRYEAAKKRIEGHGDPTKARFGVDVSRYGKDKGTLYINHAGRLWREAEFAQKDSNVYVRSIKAAAERMARQGVRSLHIRVDAGGGFSTGVVDRLKIDADLIAAFEDFRVIEVNFGGTPHDEKAYADCVTEMYAHLADSLQVLALGPVPDTLEVDLCERPYDWVNKRGYDVKQIRAKPKFRKKFGRSCDDGDGGALATAPDYILPMPRDEGFSYGTYSYQSYT